MCNPDDPNPQEQKKPQVVGTGGVLETRCMAMLRADDWALLEQQKEKLFLLAKDRPQTRSSVKHCSIAFCTFASRVVLAPCRGVQTHVQQAV